MWRLLLRAFYLNADDREKMHFCLRYFVTTYKHAIWCTFCVLNFYLKTAGRLVATRIATRIGKCLNSPKKHQWNHYYDLICSPEGATIVILSVTLFSIIKKRFAFAEIRTHNLQSDSPALEENTTPNRAGKQAMTSTKVNFG